MSPQPSTKGLMKIDINDILDENQNNFKIEKNSSYQNIETSENQNNLNQFDKDFEKDNIFFSDY